MSQIREWINKGAVLGRHLAIIACILSGGSSYAGPFDADRPHLRKLGTEKGVRIADFQFPFLVAQSAQVFDASVDELSRSLHGYLQSRKLPIKGHFSKTGTSSEQLNREVYRLPASIISGDELSALTDCTVDDCKMKLHLKMEASKVQRAQDKLAAFHDIIIDRIRSYLEHKEFRGYENRLNNQEYAKKLVTALGFFQSDYPEARKFLLEDFWKSESLSKVPRNSFLIQEVVRIQSDKMRPIFRIGEFMEFEEGVKTLYFLLPIYTSHYFDSSARTFEVLPFPQSVRKSILVVTDIMEVDELKKSALIRFLYRNQMQEGIFVFQKEEIAGISLTIKPNLEGPQANSPPPKTNP